MIKNGSVRKRGNKWYYSFEIGKIDGKRKRIERVCKTATTKAAALVEMAEAIKLYESGGIVQNKTDELTVNDFAALWIANYAKVAVKGTTQKNYVLAMEEFKSEYGMYKLKSISRLTAQEYVNKLHSKGLAYGTIRIKMVTLHGAFEYAINTLGIFETNPITKYKIPKEKVEKEKTNRAYTQEEVTQIFKDLKNRIQYGYYIACLIAFKTGMREGEIFGLTPDDIDLRNRKITVKNNLQITVAPVESRYFITTPKTKSSSRQIVIDDALVEELKKYKKHIAKMKLKYGEFYKKLYINEHGEVVERQTNNPIEFFVCQDNGRFIVCTTFLSTLKTAERHLKFKVTMHSFRHTHATMLLENGLNIKAVQDRLGHSSVKTTLDVYSEVTEKMQKETLDAVSKLSIADNF